MTTTTRLISQVRNQLQETNDKPITDQMIISALNRGQSFAFDIYARYYPDPLLVEEGPLNADADNEITIPENVFEDRMQKIELEQSGQRYYIERISYRDTTPLNNTNFGLRPTHYSIIGRQIRLYPTSGNSGLNYYIWYLKELEELQVPQGRVRSLTVSTPSTNAFVVVDSVGSDLDTSDDYGKYVNFCDSQTGLIKGTLEIQKIEGTKITFKKTLSRTSVENRTISDDLPATLEIDDYLAPIGGTAVLQFRRPTENFVIQFAVAEIRRALGYDVGLEQSALDRFEQQVKRTWAGRETTLRIKRKNPIWTSRTFWGDK